MKYLMTSVLATLSLVGTAATAEKPDSMKTYFLDPIVVIGTNTEALRSRVPNAVSIVSQQDISQSGETSILTLVNRLVPGVFVTERGVLGYGVSTGAAGGISIRGTGGNPNTGVLVLTDGRPQMMGLMGHPLPDTYVSSGIERVEILRGPASLMHGTNAMGGVINIVRSKTFRPGPSFDAGLAHGNFGTTKLEAGSAIGFGKGGISISGNHYETDGHRPYSSFTTNNGAVRGSIPLDEHFTFQADANISAFRTYDPGPASRPRVDNWVDIGRGSSGFAIENNHSIAQGALKAFFNWGIHDIFDGFHSTDNNLGALVYQAFHPFPNTITTLGVDYKRYGGRANNRKTGVNFGKHFEHEYGTYLLIQHAAAEFLNLNGGLRLNRGSVYGTELVPQAGIAANVAARTTIKLSAAKGFRSPTIRELYLFPAPTPTLQPERMWNYEVGILQTFSNTATAEVTVYQSEGSNMIRTEGVFPNLRLRNSGAFKHRGVEAAATIKPEPRLSLDMTYSYLDPDQQTMANPRHKLYVGGALEMEPVTMSLGVQFVSGLYGADFSRQAIGDYVVVNARTTVHLASLLSAYVAAENLLNRQYQIMYDYPMPGTIVLAGISYGIR